MSSRYERDRDLEPLLDPPEGMSPAQVREKFPGAIERWFFTCSDDDDRYRNAGSLAISDQFSDRDVLIIETDVPQPPWLWDPETHDWYLEDDETSPYFNELWKEEET